MTKLKNPLKHWSNFKNLGTKHPWVKGIQVSSNEELINSHKDNKDFSSSLNQRYDIIKWLCLLIRNVFSGERCGPWASCVCIVFYLDHKYSCMISLVGVWKKKHALYLHIIELIAWLNYKLVDKNWTSVKKSVIDHRHGLENRTENADDWYTLFRELIYSLIWLHWVKITSKFPQIVFMAVCRFFQDR